MKNFCLVMVKNRVFTKCKWSVFLFLFHSTLMLSQQVNISAPNLFFSSACASSNWNNYSVSFTYAPSQNFGVNNEFILELSNSEGDFNTPVQLAVLKSNRSPQTVNFSLPENTIGEKYRVRVRSTAPVKIGNPSIFFPAYNKRHNQFFTINNFNSEVTICDGSSYTLRIDNTGTDASPLFYPELNYVWYKDDKVIPSEKGSSLVVKESGVYYAVTDYGSCSPSESYSNKVTVTKIAANSEVAISSSSLLLCSNTPVVLSSNSTDLSYSYQWYLENTIISGATSSQYNALIPGNYHLIITLGKCRFSSNTINLKAADDFTASMDIPSRSVLLPGDTKIITVTTDAVSPEFRWYKDDIMLSGNDTNVIMINSPGRYKVVIKQINDCIIEKPLETVIEYPTGFNAIIKVDEEYQECVSTSGILSLSQLEAITSDGGRTDVLDQLKNINYQWYKNNEEIVGANSDHLVVKDRYENGEYKLQIKIVDFETIVSNMVKVNPALSEEIIIRSDQPLCPTNPSVLSSNITDTSYTYQWYLEDNIISGANSFQYKATIEGKYHLVIALDQCQFTSNTIDLKVVDITASMDVPARAILLPGETRKITVITDAVLPEFKWYKDDAIIEGEITNTIIINSSGNYKVVVKQTSGCIIEKSLETVIEYPKGFNATIKVDGEYQECVSTSSRLLLSKLEAVISDGVTIDVSDQLENVSYQWYKDEEEVKYAVKDDLIINNLKENGNYLLQINIAGFGTIQSNVIMLKLALEKEITISTDEVLCENNPVVTIMNDSTITDFELIYEWYKKGSENVIGTKSTLEVNTSGIYRLKVSTPYGCIQYSNFYEVIAFDESSVTVNVPEDITIVNGSSKIISARGAQNYTWYKDNAIINTTSDLTIKEEGVYLLVAAIGNCEVTKTFRVTLTENTSVIIPNVISPNGDGRNDTWNLPNDYAYQSNVEIMIISSGGKILFQQKEYQNNWPQTSFDYSNGPVVYYQIIKEGKVVKRGSITILK